MTHKHLQLARVMTIHVFAVTQIIIYLHAYILCRLRAAVTSNPTLHTFGPTSQSAFSYDRYNMVLRIVK